MTGSMTSLRTTSANKWGQLLVTHARLIFVVSGLAYMAFAEPRFFRISNLINVLNQSSTIGLLAVGLTLILLTGGIDLSMPAVMGLSAIVGAWAMSQGVHPLLGVLLMLVVGATAGSINGLAVSRLRMVPFVVTLAMMQVATGLAVWITKSVSIVVPGGVIDVVLFEILGIPLPVFIFALSAVAATYLTRETVYGRWIMAIGVNSDAAEVVRIPTSRVLMSLYVLGGMVAAVAGLMLSSRLGAAGSSMGAPSVVLDMFTAAVVGGVSIYGGIGSPMGAAMGAILIAVLNNSLNLLQVGFFPGLVLKGVLLVLFVALDTSSTRGRDR